MLTKAVPSRTLHYGAGGGGIGREIEEAMYEIKAKIVVPSASQKAAKTESSIKLCPALFRFLKGIGEPLSAQPTAHDTKNTNHATLITTTVTCLTNSTKFNTVPTFSNTYIVLRILTTVGSTLSMTAHFVSKRAVIGFGTHLMPPLTILGPSHVGSRSILFSYVFLGFPTRRKLVELSKTNQATLEELDRLSSGSRLGTGVTVRSHCVIYENVELSDEVELGHNVLIREGTVVGTKTKIGTGTVVDGHSIIGDDSNIQSGVYIPIGTRIGNRVFIGPRAVITNDKYPPSKRIVETFIEDDAVIGANSTIVAGVRIGKRAVVAAGAVVTKDVDPDTVVAGVPARPIMKREEYEARKKLYEESGSTVLK